MKKRTAKPTKNAPAPVVPAPRGRRGGPVSVVSAYVPPELSRALRIRAAEDGVTASSIVATALSAHLGIR